MTSLMDASSALHGWHEYPIAVFPAFWEWMAAMIADNNVAVVRENLAEIKHGDPECHAWFKNARIAILSPDDAILHTAKSLADRLGIMDDGYHKRGVDYNDLLLVAAASVWRCDVITNESPQPRLPSNRARYKIPAVCTELCNPAIATYSFRDWFVDRRGNRPFTSG